MRLDEFDRSVCGVSLWYLLLQTKSVCGVTRQGIVLLSSKLFDQIWNEAGLWLENVINRSAQNVQLRSSD